MKSTKAMKPAMKAAMKAMKPAMKAAMKAVHEGDEARNEGSDESNETSYESSNEGSHEGQESHEGEQDRKGEDGPVSRVSRRQREDERWHDQGKVGEEQVWQDCEQGSFRSVQKSLRIEPAEEVDGGDEAGAQAAQHHGLRRLRRQDSTGEGAVRQDQKHPLGQVTSGVQASKPLSFVVMLQGVNAASFQGR